MIKLLIISIVGFVLFVLLVGGASSWRSQQKEKSWQSVPGKMQFDAMNDEITSYKGSAAYGNNELAKKIAEEFSAALSKIRDEGFTEGSKSAFSISKGNIMTSCSATDENILIISHVPQLRKFTDDAKEMLMTYAWKLGQKVVESKNPNFTGTVTIGLRGIVLYYQFWKGKIIGIPMTRLDNKQGLEDAYRILAPIKAAVSKDELKENKIKTPAESVQEPSK